MIWPSLPGMGTFVQVGSHVGLVENQATGFSWCGTLAVVGRMAPERRMRLSFWPVV